MIKTVRTLQIAYFILAIIGVSIALYYNYRRLQELEKEVALEKEARNAGA